MPCSHPSATSPPPLNGRIEGHCRAIACNLPSGFAATVLSHLSLHRVAHAPAGIQRGRPLGDTQWVSVIHFERLVSQWRCVEVSSLDCGRIGEQFERDVGDISLYMHGKKISASCYRVNDRNFLSGAPTCSFAEVAERTSYLQGSIVKTCAAHLRLRPRAPHLRRAAYGWVKVVLILGVFDATLGFPGEGWIVFSLISAVLLLMVPSWKNEQNSLVPSNKKSLVNPFPLAGRGFSRTALTRIESCSSKSSRLGSSRTIRRSRSK